MMRNPAFGAIVPFSGLMTGKQRMDFQTEFARYGFRHPAIAPPAQDVAHRFRRQSARPLEGENASMKLFEPGLDVYGMERHV